MARFTKSRIDPRTGRAAYPPDFIEWDSCEAGAESVCATRVEDLGLPMGNRVGLIFAAMSDGQVRTDGTFELFRED